MQSQILSGKRKSPSWARLSAKLPTHLLVVPFQGRTEPQRDFWVLLFIVPCDSERSSDQLKVTPLLEVDPKGDRSLLTSRLPGTAKMWEGCQ